MAKLRNKRTPLQQKSTFGTTLKEIPTKKERKTWERVASAKRERMKQRRPHKMQRMVRRAPVLLDSSKPRGLGAKSACVTPRAFLDDDDDVVPGIIHNNNKLSSTIYICMYVCTMQYVIAGFSMILYIYCISYVIVVWKHAIV